MPRRSVVIGLLVLGLISGGACTAPRSTTVTPMPCDESGAPQVVYAGDSLVPQWSIRVHLPAEHGPVLVAKGGSGYTPIPTGDPLTTLSLGERLLGFLDSCAGVVALVVVHAGANDLSGGQPVGPVTEKIAELDAQLGARGVRVAWVPITPWALSNAAGYDNRYVNRLALNDWLRSPGHVTGPVLECNDSLRVPGADPEVLDPRWWSYADAFSVDRYHPNLAGYDAYAACMEPQINALLHPA